MTGALDSYQHRARVQPAFLCLLPASATVAITLGSSRGLVSGIVTLAASTGATYLVATFVRDRGRRIEKDLWASWGGKPTTQLLRAPVDEPHGTLVRRWTIMAKLMSKHQAEDDQGVPTDDEIDAYVGRLRALTRDDGGYRLVNRENAGYGFRRNLLGLRRTGVALTVLSSAWDAVAIGLAVTNNQVSHAWLCAGVLVGDLSSCFIWLRFINSEWVKRQAFNYARALFDAAETLDSQSTS